MIDWQMLFTFIHVLALGWMCGIIHCMVVYLRHEQKRNKE